MEDNIINNMTSYSYNIEKYESLLKSEMVNLTIIAVVLALLFIAIIVFSIAQIKGDKTKKMPYVQLAGSIVVFVFLAFSLGSQIISYEKDIAEKAYIQYEGPATLKTKRQIIFGGLPTGYNEYVVSFEQDGDQIELYTRKDLGFIGDIEKLYVVYSKYSNYIFEITQ